MAWSLVAKVEYVVVGKVVKLVVEVGSLVFYGGKEEEEDGMEVLLLLEMEEEMEEKEVEEFVVEKMEEMERMVGQKKRKMAIFLGCCRLQGTMKEKKE